MKKASLYEKLNDHTVRCVLCAHRCCIDDGCSGTCGVRQNVGGELYTYAYGNVAAAASDPIEKKPLYHFLPGTQTFSIAIAGCNFTCDFCQNWQIAQFPAEHRAKSVERREKQMLPEQIVEEALACGCESIAYTYTEPTIFFEYAYDVARLAQQKGIKNIFVTNGFMSVEALDMIVPYLDACNVDLKSFQDDFYREFCGGCLAPVCAAIKKMKELDIWVEVTTLVIPGRNDSPEELNALAGFIASVGQDIPWHISRFHPLHQCTDLPFTPGETMDRAAECGKAAGLQYIYFGNRANMPDVTACAQCGYELIRRKMPYHVEKNEVINGACPVCGTKVAGIF